MMREKSLTGICTLLLDSTIGNTKDKIYDYKGYDQQIKIKFNASDEKWPWLAKVFPELLENEDNEPPNYTPPVAREKI